MKKLNITTILYCLILFITACGPNVIETKPSVGTVEVNLTYPSEYLPEMDIYLLNIDNNQTLIKRSILNISPVTFKNVSEGNYVVYAITVEKFEPPEIGLGEKDYNAPKSKYNCAKGGYSKNPQDWNLSPFIVTKGKCSVEINDWDVNIPGTASIDQ